MTLSGVSQIVGNRSLKAAVRRSSKIFFSQCKLLLVYHRVPINFLKLSDSFETSYQYTHQIKDR